MGFELVREFAAAFLSTLLIPAASGADEHMRALNGAVLAAPEIAALECDAMKELLDVYLDSGYRSAAPVPPGHPDYPIFDYEDRLAAAYFYRCLARGSALSDAKTVGIQRPSP